MNRGLPRTATVIILIVRVPVVGGLISDYEIEDEEGGEEEV